MVHFENEIRNCIIDVNLKRNSTSFNFFECQNISFWYVFDQSKLHHDIVGMILKTEMHTICPFDIIFDLLNITFKEKKQSALHIVSY